VMVEEGQFCYNETLKVWEELEDFTQPGGVGAAINLAQGGR